MYHPHDSGLLHGGGQRRFKLRRNVMRGGSLKHFPDVHISDHSGIKQRVPEFDPALEFEYSKRELLLLAEKILPLSFKQAVTRGTERFEIRRIIV